MKIKTTQKELAFLEKRIENAHPKNILKRGYAIIRDEAGAFLDFETITLQQNINIELKGGLVKTIVQEKHKNG